MQITKEHIKSKKRIGETSDSPVFELHTTGGRVLVVVLKNGASKVIGAGPHRAIARHLASEIDPSLRITELSKSDDLLPFEAYCHLLPKYRELTKRFNRG